MQINSKKFDDWSSEEIMSLLGAEEFKESEFLDYKKSFEKTKADEYRQDICSFANAKGGFIFFGIEEQDSLAANIFGVENLGLDKYSQMISNYLCNGNIQPNPPRFSCKYIKVGDKYVLVIHVLEGLDKPYLVNNAKFMIRRTSGKNEMTYAEIQDYFDKKNNVKSVVSDLISTRSEFINTLPSSVAPQFFIYFIPRSYISGISKRYSVHDIDITRLTFGNQWATYMRTRHNMDGLLAFREYSTSKYSHVQFFNEGILEFFTQDIIDDVDPDTISGRDIMFATLHAFMGIRDYYQYQKVQDEELFVIAGLRNIASMTFNSDLRWNPRKKIDRNVITTQCAYSQDLSRQSLESARENILMDIGYAFDCTAYYEKYLENGAIANHKL